MYVSRCTSNRSLALHALFGFLIATAVLMVVGLMIWVRRGFKADK